MAESELIVFVVDDDEAARESLQALLESAGHRAQTFAGGEAFLEAAGPRTRGCLILDLHMPGLDGFQVQAKLSERGVILPIIILTGCCDKATRARALAAGAIALLEKPVRDEDLLNTLGTALARLAPASARPSSGVLG
jgi:two-component system response regulator FixJ